MRKVGRNEHGRRKEVVHNTSNSQLKAYKGLEL
jgi:hypothetical protein